MKYILAFIFIVAVSYTHLNGIMPPAILVRPEISALVLSKLFTNRFKDVQKLCDDLFVNSGLLENKTDRDFYEELMKLYQTSSLT